MDVSRLKIGGLDARVEFSLDAEAMKGRRGFRTGIRPNHWLSDREYTFMGKLEFIDCEWLGPGEKCVSVARLIVAEQDKGRFVPGFCWQVGESNRIVGSCRLLSIERPYESLPSQADQAQ